MNGLNQELSQIRNKHPRSSAPILDALTKDLMEKYESSASPIKLRLVENDGRVSLWTSSEVCINNLLPKGYIIEPINARVYAADIENKKLIIPKDINDGGVEIIIKLVHEIGHILDPDALTRTKRRTKLIESRRQDGLTFEEEIELSNLALEGEAWAWHYGLALSSLFGVDLIEYESDMSQELGKYFVNQIKRIGLLNKKKDENKLTKVVLFNPLIQDFQEMNL